LRVGVRGARGRRRRGQLDWGRKGAGKDSRRKRRRRRQSCWTRRCGKW